MSEGDADRQGAVRATGAIPIQSTDEKGVADTRRPKCYCGAWDMKPPQPESATNKIRAIPLLDYGAGAVHRLSNRSIPQKSSALPDPTPDFRCQAFPKGEALASNKKPHILTDERKNKLQKSVMTNRIPAVDVERKVILCTAPST